MAPSRKKEEKKTEEIKEEIGIFVFPDGSRYDGQFIKKVSTLDESDPNNQQGGKGGTPGQYGGQSLNDPKGGGGRRSATPTQMLAGDAPDAYSAAVTAIITKASSGGENGGAVTTSTIMYRHGNGVFVDGNTTYDGTWDYDRMHGFGRLTTKASSSSIKNSSNNNSQQQPTSSTSSCYVGYFVNNEFDGKGQYRWSDSSWYEGQWRNNKMHGEGVYCDCSGKKWKGRFYNGEGVNLAEVEESEIEEN